MKKLLLTLLLLLLSINVLSGDTKYFYDNAYLLTDEQRETVENNLSIVSSQYGIDVVLLTVDSINTDIEVYADDFYDNNGFKDDGIIFVLVMDSRQWYVSTSGICINKIDDQEIDYIADDMIYYLSNGDYYNAFLRYSNDVKKYYEIDNNYVDDDILVNKDSSFDYKNILISLGISILITLIVMIILKKQLNNVKRNHFAGNYIVDGSFILTGFSDFFITRHVSRTPIPKNTNNNGGSNVHISSSGSSHGGHGGHF